MDSCSTTEGLSPAVSASKTPQAPSALAAPEYLQGLNEAQRAAAMFGTHEDGDQPASPLLVIAGAGSGKTSTLAHRVAHLIACGADPNRILLLTFTTRAAEEMSRRVVRILVQLARARSRTAGASLPWSGTFHSVGARLLREYAGRIGLAPGFTIHDREDSADLMNLVRHDLGGSCKTKRFPLKGTCLAIYSSVVNTACALPEVLQSTYPWCVEWEEELRRLFLAYVEAKQAQAVLDYDDLLLYWARMVEQPSLGRAIGERFSHVLVDEYQDTNRLQAAILLAMKPDGRGLTVVGDDAQSIYAFRGATVRNILEFPQQFQPPAHQVTLDRNYRSTAPILAAANAVIALSRQRFAKDLWTDRTAEAKPCLVCVRDDADQAAFVVEQVLARRERGVRLRAQAVLFRAAHHSARLELELTRRNIPFVKFGGLKFLEAAHVKDVLALLRWAQNRRDRVSGFRVLQLLEGVGPKSAARLLDQIAACAPGCEALPERMGTAVGEAPWREFVALIDALSHANGVWPSAFEQGCRWYEQQMERLFDDARIRIADIQQLARIASTYPSQERFLTELVLEPPQATSDEAGKPLLDEDYLILSTIHSSKGREWTSVILLNAVDGCIPSDLATGSSDQIEEERRLLYVAMTRAREDLAIVVPQRFFVSAQSTVGDRHVYASRSRFLPAATLPYFAQLSWPPAPQDSPPPEPEEGVHVDLAGQMRAMWR